MEAATRLLPSADEATDFQNAPIEFVCHDAPASVEYRIELLPIATRLLPSAEEVIFNQNTFGALFDTHVPPALFEVKIELSPLTATKLLPLAEDAKFHQLLRGTF